MPYRTQLNNCTSWNGTRTNPEKFLVQASDCCSNTVIPTTTHTEDDLVKFITTFILLFTLSLCTSTGIAGAEVLSRSASTPTAVAAFGGLAIETNRAALTDADALVLEHVPLDMNTSVTLQLQRIDVLTSDAVIVEARHRHDGSIIEDEMAAPHIDFFHGTVMGDPDSHVFLAFGEHGTNGWIEREHALHVLTTHRRDGWTAIYDLHQIDPADMHWTDIRCATNEVATPMTHSQRNAAARGDLSCLALRVAVETDWEFTGLFGGSTSASAEYAMTLLAAASSVYDRDIGIAITVSYLRLWANSDDPWSGADSGAQLGQFQAHWTSQMDHVDRHLAHFLSGRGLGGGVAYLGGVCNNAGYAVSGNINGSFPMPLEHNNGGNWDPMVVMHEIGHNCGTGHTHDSYNPPLDGCGNSDCTDADLGTIMSYCHLCSGGLSNMAMEFHPEVQLVIENYLSTGISCELAGDGSPPVAVADIVQTLLGDTVDVPVLANDYTNDCSAAILDSWDTISQDGHPVELVNDDPDAAILRYTSPSNSEDSGDIFHYGILDGSGQPSTSAVLIVFQEARAADTPAATAPGPLTAYYDLESPQVLPDFDLLEPYLTEVLADVNYPSTNGVFAGSGLSDDFGVVFHGFIDVDVAGWYTLYTNSDDGSALYIGDQMVVENDGTHGMRERSGTIALQPGRHAIRVEFFERGGGAGCIVSIESSTLAKQFIPADMWSHEIEVIGDITGDGIVDVLDLLSVILDWGSCIEGSDCPADLDGNGAVDVEDLLIVIGAWN